MDQNILAPQQVLGCLQGLVKPLPVLLICLVLHQVTATWSDLHNAQKDVSPCGPHHAMKGNEEHLA